MTAGEASDLIDAHHARKQLAKLDRGRRVIEGGFRAEGVRR